MHVYMYTIYARMYVCMYISMYVCMYARLHVCMYLTIYVCLSELVIGDGECGR